MTLKVKPWLAAGALIAGTALAQGASVTFTGYVPFDTTRKAAKATNGSVAIIAIRHAADLPQGRPTGSGELMALRRQFARDATYTSALAAAGYGIEDIVAVTFDSGTATLWVARD